MIKILYKPDQSEVTGLLVFAKPFITQSKRQLDTFMSKILIIDDDKEICQMLVRLFEKSATTVLCAFTLSDGLEQLRTTLAFFDVVFLDIYLPDGNGIGAIETIKTMFSPPEIIIMTGAGDLESIRIAIEFNVWDYIEKSESPQKFKFALERALEYRQQKLSRPAYENIIKRKLIIGQSASILKCLKQVSLAANDTIPVMITGDTGTGKELFARAIHENSCRHNKEFVVVDCAALPEHLVESVLFGHSKGAFTGANDDHAGLLTMAGGGTLFLDEIGELPWNIQKKFLRVLQEKKIRPVGSTHEISSNFRFIGATHRDLLGMVQNNTFREDLYYRIFSLTIKLPPLKERHGDIALIAKAHIGIKNSLLKKEAFKMSEEFLEELENYNWPGNIRELKNTIDRACSQIVQGEALFPKHLPEAIRSFNLSQKILNKTIRKSGSFSEKPPLFSNSSSTSNPGLNSKIVPLKKYIAETKYNYILNLLNHTRGDIKQCCLLSGLSRGHLYNLFKKYGIKP